MGALTYWLYYSLYGGIRGPTGEYSVTIGISNQQKEIETECKEIYKQIHVDRLNRPETRGIVSEAAMMLSIFV